MDKVEAKKLLAERVADLRGRSYSDLLRRMDAPETVEIVGPSGTRYQVETQVWWDAKRGEALRVVVSIDDFGWRSFVPMSFSFVKSADD
jgi:hypothetical protein